jgi:hypothetical protein
MDSLQHVPMFHFPYNVGVTRPDQLPIDGSTYGSVIGGIFVARLVRGIGVHPRVTRYGSLLVVGRKKLR